MSCTLVKGHIGHVNTLTYIVVVVVVIITIIIVVVVVVVVLSCARKCVVLVRRPLVRDCGSCASSSSPAGRSGGSLIFGTRCRLSLPRHARPSPRAGHIAPKQNASRPTNRRVHRFRKIRPGGVVHPQAGVVCVCLSLCSGGVRVRTTPASWTRLLQREKRALL